MKQIHLASAESPGTSLINLKCGLGIFDFFFFFFPFSTPFCSHSPNPGSGLTLTRRCSCVCWLPRARRPQFGGKLLRPHWSLLGTRLSPLGVSGAPSWGDLPRANKCHRLGQPGKDPLAFNRVYLFMACVYIPAPPSLATRLWRGCQSN